jgi:AAA domain
MVRCWIDKAHSTSIITIIIDMFAQSHRLSRPPMGNSEKLAAQVMRYLTESSLDDSTNFPIFNAPQRAAIEAALTRRMTLIQGPPGTGKVRALFWLLLL